MMLRTSSGTDGKCPSHTSGTAFRSARTADLARLHKDESFGPGFLRPSIELAISERVLVLLSQTDSEDDGGPDDAHAFRKLARMLTLV